MFRQIGAASQSLDANLSVFGSGAMLTGGIKVLETDFLVFGTSYGDGVAHCIAAVSGLGLDAAVNATQTGLEALPVFTSSGGYEHRWSRTLRSTVTYGFVQVTNSPPQDGSVFHSGHYASGNIVWRPFRTGEAGFEYLFGEHVVKDGARATASRGHRKRGQRWPSGRRHARSPDG